MATIRFVDGKRLGVDDPPLDLPEAVRASIALAFHAAVVHEAPGRGCGELHGREDSKAG